MLNYSTHALEELSRSDLEHLPTLNDTKAMREILTALTKGIKFELPENGCLFGDNYTLGFEVIDTSLLHLPFPTTVLEYPFTLFDGKNPEMLHIPKRIVICLDYEAHKESYLAWSALQSCPGIDEVGGIIMVPVFCSPLVGWYPLPFGVVMPRIDPDTPRSGLFHYLYGKGRQSKVGFRPFIILASAAEKAVQRLGVEKAIKDAAHDNGEEITSLISFLAALSCSNVVTEHVEAPAKLNAKRAKSGKLPFYSYKIITINTQQAQPVLKRASGSGRQSPREHIRRGHIRHLNDNRRIWINSMVVGNSKKGSIGKRYQVV